MSKTRHFVIQYNQPYCEYPLYVIRAGGLGESNMLGRAEFYKSQEDAVKDAERYAVLLRKNGVTAELHIMEVSLKDTLAKVTAQLEQETET